MYKVLIVMGLALLSACSATGPKFNAVSHPTNDSLIYVYRPDLFQNGAISPGIVVDNEERLLLQNNGYTYFYLPPGQHQFSILLSDRYTPAEPTKLLMEAGAVYYLKLVTGNIFNSMPGVGLSVNRKFGLISVEEEIGKAEIQDCRYLNPSESKKFSKSYFLESN